VSQRWEWGTIHLNAEMALTRDHHADLFLGPIIEGPSRWSVRPIAEFLVEQEFDQFNGIRSGRSHLAGSRQSQFRHRSPARSHQWPPGK